MSVVRTESHLARNYDPLPVELTAGEGAWVTDTAGRRYLDLLAGYGALSFGHRHPTLVAAAHAQLDRLTLTSRAFGNDQLEAFAAELADLVGYDLVLPMNTGAEAVETAIKVTRRWATDVRGIPDSTARIITFAGGFHGRTTTIVGFSTDPVARRGFGPFTPGFDTVPLGDLDALAAAITPTTAGVLLEPIQGEAGVVVPPPGWLAGVRRLCDEHRLLLVADEVQSGLGRTGTTLACDAEGVRADLVLLGKALGGGIVALSAVCGDEAVLGVLDPGSHGSTFGGNPLAAAIGRAVVGLLRPGDLQARAASLGAWLLDRFADLPADRVSEVRGRGLWIGIDLAPGMPPARVLCEQLLGRGLLVKDAHTSTIRLAPPLVVDAADLDRAAGEVCDVVRGGGATG
jgi:ornithine--oxo-acid transaminase